MEATELRIGNLVYNDRVTNSITAINTHSVTLLTPQGNEISASLELIKPIPLTSEWLEKFGFDPAYHKLTGEHSHLPTRYNLNGFQIYIQYYHGSEETCYYELEMNPAIEIKHIHQIQNIYFALTGEELTIKDETK